MAPPYCIETGAFLSVAGVPTLESLKTTEASIPSGLRAALLASGPQRLYESVGGTFSVGSAETRDDGRRLVVTALSDFSGYNSLFYLDTPDFFAVGNRASFVGAFRARYPRHNDIDAEALSWLVGTTMIMGTRTPFADVSRVRTGYCISFTRDPALGEQRAEVSRMSPHHFDGGAAKPDGNSQRFRAIFRRRRVAEDPIDLIDFKSACMRIGNRAKWCLDRGIRFRAHLTGGRDTRLIAGILADQDMIEPIDRFTSFGTEENGDVVVARQVARALGLNDRHVVAPGGKTASTLSTEDFYSVLRRLPFLYEGHLSAWDGRRSLVKRMPSWVMFMGGGGEIYRQEWGSSSSLVGEDGARRAWACSRRTTPWACCLSQPIAVKTRRSPAR